jgi:hypothetical protein
MQLGFINFVNSKSVQLCLQFSIVLNISYNELQLQDHIFESKINDTLPVYVYNIRVRKI